MFNSVNFIHIFQLYQLKALASSCNPDTGAAIYVGNANFEQILLFINLSTDLDTLISSENWQEPLRSKIKCPKLGRGSSPNKGLQLGQIMRLMDQLSSLTELLPVSLTKIEKATVGKGFIPQ